MPKTKRKKTTDRLSDRALFDLASQYEAMKDRWKSAEHDPEHGWRSVQTRIVSELQRRKVKSLTDSSHAKITLVAPETVVYNEDGLWAALTPAKRKLVFDRTISLSKLPRDVQEALLEHLTKEQRRQVVDHKLNAAKLERAVAEKKIPIVLVSDNSEIKESSPYIVVSHGEV